MKMVKKVMLGMVALAAVLTLASCGKKDDPEGVIKGGGNNIWYIDYANEGTDTYRAYKETSQKHAGVIAKIRFDTSNTQVDNYSKMGLIFNLFEKNGKKNFFIIGISPDGHWYVSEYRNVTDIRAKNFGVADADVKTSSAAATVTDTSKPYEFVWEELTQFESGSADTNKFTMPAADSEGYKNVYIWFQADNGSFQWKISTNLTEAQINSYSSNTGAWPTGASYVESGLIDDAAWTTNTTTPKQGDVALYAQIQKSSTLKGKWKIEKFYKEAEDIEE